MNLKQIYKILEEVTDPEIPVITIAELGILNKVDIDQENKITVYITPTYAGCPAMDMITVNIKAILQEYGYHKVEVISLLDPTWTTDMISQAGLKKLLDYGIAPPAEKTSDVSFLNGRPPTIPCPQCSSTNTQMISRFGSTACKALYKCNDCLEPFDYFKCH